MGSSVGSRARMEAYLRNCDWCGHRIPDYNRSAHIVLGDNFFCSRKCAETYIASVERQKKSIYEVMNA